MANIAVIGSGYVGLGTAAVFAGEIINLGNPDGWTIADFARAAQAGCGTHLPVAFCPLPTDDPTRRCPDIVKARRLLGWEPTVGLDEGTMRTIAYFRALVEISPWSACTTD